MKFTNVITKIDFTDEDLRQALADYVDFYHHKPDLAESIRRNSFQRCRDSTSKFSIKVKTGVK
mgnify:FL=1|jgi:hypothetical protein